MLKEELKAIAGNRKCMIYAGITFVIMITIFVLSAQNGETSGALSGRVERLLRAVLGETIFKQWLTGMWLNVRKFAHVFIYAMLGLFSYLTVQSASKQVPAFERRRTRILYVLLFCFLYACSDEFHQIFVPGRAGMVRDVLIDSLGYGTAVLLTSIISH